MWLYLLCILSGILVVGLVIILIVRFISRIGRYPKNIFLPLPPPGGKRPMLLEEVEKITTLDIHEVKEKNPEVLTQHCDVIVIGSGISGMTSAGFLSRAGKSVLILEQHDRLGGYTHEFTEPGERSGVDYSFCPGIHYLGKLNTTNVLPFTVLSGGQLKFREFKGKEQYEMGSGEKMEMIKVDAPGYKKLRKVLIDQFPEEKEAIIKYWGKMNKVVTHAMNYILKQMAPWYYSIWLNLTSSHSLFTKYSNTPVEKVMDECGLKNKALRQFLYVTPLAYYNGTFMEHVDFSSLAMIFMGITHKNIPYGPYGSGGGSFSRTLIPNLSEKCHAVCNARVSKILFKNSKACGVELADDLGKITCDKIITCAGFQNTYNLLPKRIQKTQAKPIPALVKKYPYCGFFYIIFIGLDADPEDIGMEKGLYVMTGSKSMDVYSQIRELKEPEFEGYEDCHVIAISNDVEQEFQKKNPGHTKIQVITFMSDKWVEKYENTLLNQRGNDYEEIKKNLESKVLDILFKRFPKMEEHIDYLDSGTSITCKHYVDTPKGSGYGMVLKSSKWMKMNSDELVNPINGIYFCGADILCGVPGGLYSSMNVVGRILKRNLYLDIKDARLVQKKRMKEKKE